MTREIDQLKQLKTLTDAAYQAERSKLAVLVAEEARLRARLSDLDEARSARNDTLRLGPDTAVRAGADPRWHHWADGRRVALNQSLAQIQVAKDVVHQTLGRAFGRRDVSKQLLKSEVSAMQKALDKKRDQIS